MQYIRLLLFYSVIFQSVIFQSCKFQSPVCLMLQDGQSALHVSSRLGDDDTVQLLLQHNADIDALMRDHYTPLHIAVKHQHSTIINILLSHGAKLDIKSKVYQRSHKMALSGGNKVMFTDSIVVTASANCTLLYQRFTCQIPP